MSKLINEIGNTYGYLTVIERAPNGSNNKARWVCSCKCGNTTLVDGSKLRNGSVKSCGCYQKEQTSKSCVSHLEGKTIGNFFVLNSVGSKNRLHYWRCKCLLCGNKNAIIATNNLNKQYSCGCSVKSHGEEKIKNLLDSRQIKYIQEKRFSDCIFPDTKRQARFDFYLPDYNCIIEYDGRQHFISGNGIYDNEEKFIKTKEHDMIKNQYCFNNHIHLIRIPFTHYNDLTINDLLPHTSQFLLLQ